MFTNKFPKGNQGNQSTWCLVLIGFLLSNLGCATLQTDSSYLESRLRYRAQGHDLSCSQKFTDCIEQVEREKAYIKYRYNLP